MNKLPYYNNLLLEKETELKKLEKELITLNKYNENNPNEVSITAHKIFLKNNEISSVKGDIDILQTTIANYKKIN